MIHDCFLGTASALQCKLAARLGGSAGRTAQKVADIWDALVAY
jgi:hypothetical protein